MRSAGRSIITGTNAGAIDVFLETLHVLDTVLDHGDPRRRPARAGKPARGGVTVIGLGRHEHPVDFGHLGRIGEDARLGANHPLRRLHFDGVERRASGDGDVVPIILEESGRERGADGTRLDQKYGSHAPILPAHEKQRGA